MDNFAERRKYVRLDTVFPVEYRLFSKIDNRELLELKQGFTRNVSEGGVCLEITQLKEGSFALLTDKNNYFELFINTPHKKEPIKAKAEIRWQKIIKQDFPSKYLLGLEYTDIEDSTRKQIIQYAKSRIRRPKLIALSIAMLTAACGLLIWQVRDLGIKKSATEKQMLVFAKELTKSYENRMSLENKIYILNIKKSTLNKSLKKSRKEIDALEERLSKLSIAGNEVSDELVLQKVKLERELIRWNNEKSTLVQELNSLSSSKDQLNEELSKVKDYSQAKIIRVRLSNGNSIIGQLIDVTPDRVFLKIGLGSIGVERTMISDIKELSYTEKIDIKTIWEKQEKEAKKDEIKYKKFIEEQHKKGFVYFNGKWIKEEDAAKIEEASKKREDDIFKVIAQQTAQNYSKQEMPSESITPISEMPIISIKNDRLYINGRLFFIKGVAYGIEYPGTNGGMDTFKHVPLSIFEKDFEAMKKAGINTIRTYEPLPDKLLDLAEKYGIMVIENICYPNDNTDFNSMVHLDILKEQIKKYVIRDKNRKCILMWSIWNDAPWAWGAAGNVVKRYGIIKVNNFLKELYNTVKKYDVSHPVTASNAVDLEGEQLGWDFLDVIGLNMYVGGFDWFIQKDAESNMQKIKKIEEMYNKPVAILETGFSTFVKGQEQSDVLEKQIKILGTNVCGITIFQWADGWQKAGNKNKQDDNIEEHWGILDGYRNPKPGFSIVSKYFNEIPSESMGYQEDSTSQTKL